MENTEIESQLVDGEDSCLMLASNIREMFETVEPPLSSECCIYRVHNTLRKLNEAAYTPKLVSIGSFHYGKVGLKTMERYKVVCLQEILRRDGVSSSLEEFLIYIKQQEKRVRDCYAESIKLSSDEFVKMILLDASFILELWSVLFVELVQDEIYYVISRPWMTNCIMDDLSLLENQLPFFVLEGLYDLFFPSNRYNDRPSFFSLVRRSFNFNNQEILPGRVQDIKHFTDFIRTFMLPSSPRLEPKTGKSGQLSYSAVELHQSGVKFKVSSSKCLFDIQFSNGVLHIPNLRFVDSTESCLRNLMALEQCHYPRDTYICDYIILMDALIDTGKDVELLIKHGIISNDLGLNDALATIINNLGLEIIVPGHCKSYFCRLCQDLIEYYKKPRHSWKAALKRDYFSTPWRIASTAAAIMLLGLTFIQTVNSFGKH